MRRGGLGVCDAGYGRAGGCGRVGVWEGYVGGGSSKYLCYHEGESSIGLDWTGLGRVG